MATDLENSLRAVGEKLAQYVDDISTMTVETQYVEIGATGDAATPRMAARTIIRFDGDSEVVVPLTTHQSTGALEVDRDLFELHERNVALTIDYRAKMLASLVGVLQEARRR